MRKKTITAKKQIFAIFLLFAVPFSIFMVYYNFYMVDILTDKLMQTSEERLKYYQGNLEDELHNVENFMANLVANDLSFTGLQYDMSALDAHLATYGILQKYRDMLLSNPNVTGLFIYTNKHHLYRARFSDRTTMEQRSDVVTYLRSLTATAWEPGPLGWHVQEIGSDFYLLRGMSLSDAYVIAVVDLNQVRDDMPLVLDDQQSVIVTLDAQGQPLTHQDYLNENRIRLQTGQQGRKGQFLITQLTSDYLGLQFAYLLPMQGSLTRLDPLQSSLLVATVVLIALLLLCLYLIKRYYFKPLNTLSDAIAKVRSGDLEAKMEPDIRIDELRQVALAFNDMMDQIKSLKIIAYEKTLAAQQAQLQYLQIQIRPHFFLNCLSALYGLAEVGESEKMQQMILRLSRYLRTVLVQNQDLVPLCSEMNHTQDYVSIYQMSQAMPILLDMEMDPLVETVPIPPLSVLTFVENAVKHAASYGSPLHIQVRAEKIAAPEGVFLHLSISDNGPGFSREDLDAFRSDPDPAESNGHIGIMNVMRRFQIIFGSKATVQCFNASGANVDIFLPIEKREGQDV